MERIRKFILGASFFVITNRRYQMKGRLTKTMILILVVGCMVTCGAAYKEKNNYIMCSQRIIEFSKTMNPESQSYAKELKEKFLELCKIYGFRSISDFEAAKNKYEHELKRDAESAKMSNILKQITNDSTDAAHTPNSTPHFSLPVSIDLKTKLTEKTELIAIETGVKVFLKNDGVGVNLVENKEDFAVWLKNIERLFYKVDNKYSYNLTVSLSYPTDFTEKRAIKEEIIHFEFSVDEPINNKIDEIEGSWFLYGDEKERFRREAYIGGKAVADCIKNFFKSLDIK